MLRAIPQRIKKQLLASGKMSKCCIADSSCSGWIEWHHALIYAGQRQNEVFCILPLCAKHHYEEKNSEVRDRIEWVMINQMTFADETKFNKVDWKQKRSYLESKFKKTA